MQRDRHTDHQSYGEHARHTMRHASATSARYRHDEERGQGYGCEGPPIGGFVDASFRREGEDREGNQQLARIEPESGGAAEKD